MLLPALPVRPRSVILRGCGRGAVLLGCVLLLGACVSGTTVGTRIDPRSIALAHAADTTLYMDTQAFELRELLAESGIGIERQRDDIVLRLHGAATFAPEQAEVHAEVQPLLAGLAEILSAYDRTLIDVSGYTDTSGGMVGNMALSIRRAEVVAELLQEQGIAADRITARGLGPMHPVGDNDTDEGRQQNRRVELTIRPVPGPATSGPAMAASPAD